MVTIFFEFLFFQRSIFFQLFHLNIKYGAILAVHHFPIFFLARCIPNNRLVAIKQYDLETCNLSFEYIKNEISEWFNIDHPNAVKYYQSFTFGTKIWVLSECANAGSLLDMIKDNYPTGIKNEKLIA